MTVIPRMPISSAGKVDRQELLALADGDWSNCRDGESGALPQGELERSVAEVWEDMLDVRPILRDDNFFAAGGTSLRAIQLSQRLQALGYRITVQDILAALTVEALARTLAKVAGREPDAPEPGEDAATGGPGGFLDRRGTGACPGGLADHANPVGA